MADQGATYDRVWDIIEKAGVGMLTTQLPAAACAHGRWSRRVPDRKAGAIFFVTDSARRQG